MRTNKLLISFLLLIFCYCIFLTLVKKYNNKSFILYDIESINKKQSKKHRRNIYFNNNIKYIDSSYKYLSENPMDGTSCINSISSVDNIIDIYILIFNKILFNNKNNILVNFIVSYRAIKENKNYYKDGYLNIILDGEHYYLKTKYDIMITTKKNIKNSIYLPLFVSSFVESCLDPEILVKKSKNEEKHFYKNKTKFCVFMYSNCSEEFSGVVNRKIFFHMLNNTKKVDNLGKCYNKKYKKNGSWKNSYETYMDYKFVISFENKEVEGYITEKLIMPMMARCIPIYLGSSNVNEYFNPRSFINVNNFKSFQDCIDYVLKVDNEPELYQSIINEPFLYNNTIDKDLFSIYYGGRFYEEFNQKIDNIQKKYFTTFADGVKYKNTRIIKEAKESYIFFECFANSPKNFDEDFKRKHFNFITKNKRGYGYWVWKPYIIRKTLERIKKNDILLYCDSGCEIQYNCLENFNFYFNILKTYDIVCFTMTHIEKKWSKMDAVIEVLKYKNKLDKKDDIINTPQNMAGVLIIKKNEGTIHFIKDWEFLCNNYHLIDDSKSINKNDKDFIENRHDQTILSLLLKTSNLNIYFTEETSLSAIKLSRKRL
jgi:hypothetical protein